MRRSLQTWVVLFALAALGPAAHGQGSTLSLSLKGAGGLQFGGGTVNAFFPVLEYQAAAGTLLSWTVGLGYLDYTYKDHSDVPVSNYDGWSSENKGKGPALTAELRFYPGRNMFEGFNFGPGLSVIAIKQDNTNTNPSYIVGEPAPVVTYSSESQTVAEVHCRVGYAFKSGNLVIDPHLQVGYFLSAPDTGSDNSSKMGLYALAGVSLGLKF